MFNHDNILIKVQNNFNQDINKATPCQAIKIVIWMYLQPKKPLINSINPMDEKTFE